MRRLLLLAPLLGGCVASKAPQGAQECSCEPVFIQVPLAEPAFRILSRGVEGTVVQHDFEAKTATVRLTRTGPDGGDLLNALRNAEEDGDPLEMTDGPDDPRESRYALWYSREAATRPLRLEVEEDLFAFAQTEDSKDRKEQTYSHKARRGMRYQRREPHAGIYWDVLGKRRVVSSAGELPARRPRRHDGLGAQVG